ncbi:MAG: DUF2310 family Zn-ribbon-containing protein [Acidobacteria bacterium]|nr:DUF2310 family Zn-ribbon-containing protein [Acidobacteriota bacterium]
MYYVEIEFRFSDRKRAEAALSAIHLLAASIRRGGNLMRGYELESEVNGFILHGVTPATNSFQRKYLNANVRENLAQLKHSGLSQPRIRVGGYIPETSIRCQCANPAALYLFTTFLHSGPPLSCLTCEGVIPVYQIANATDSDREACHCWEDNYKACDTLQMNCGVAERSAARQMSDMNSQLSLSGLAVCRRIAQLIGRPVYYYQYRYTARSRSAELERKCPMCGADWLLNEPLHGKFDFRCDKCHLLSNIAWDRR